MSDAARKPLRLRLLGDLTTAAEPSTVLRDPYVLTALGALLVFQVLYMVFGHAPRGISDQMEFEQIGRHFGNWWVLGDAHRTPGYPLYLAINYKLGLGNTGAMAGQALLVAVAAGGVGALVGIAGGLVPARISAWALAMYIPFFTYSSVMLSDVPSAALSVAGMLCLVLAIRSTELDWRWGTGAAVLLVLATVVRPIYLAFLVLALLVLMLRAGSWTTRLGLVGVFAVTFAVVFGPYVGRNYVHTRKAQPLGAQDHLQLTLGLHVPWDNQVGEFSPWDRSVRFFDGKRADGFTPQVAAVASPWRILKDDLTKHPADFLWSRVVAQGQLWVWPTTSATQSHVDDFLPYPLIMAEHLLLLLLGLVAVVRARAHLVGRLVLALTLITMGQYLFLFSTPRYAFAASVFLVGMSGITISWLFERAGRPRVAQAQVPAG
ncbi:MAG TPA: hypothetical protein VIG37_23465 [Methylomirabilota bacterium]